MNNVALQAYCTVGIYEAVKSAVENFFFEIL